MAKIQNYRYFAKQNTIKILIYLMNKKKSAQVRADSIYIV